MNLSAKSININSSTDIRLHPLAKKLAKLLNYAYSTGGQEDYLKSMNAKFNSYKSLPINNVSVISSQLNSYEVIAGCFVPFFNLNALNNDNTIFIQYKSSKKNVQPEHRKQMSKEFDQDIIDFIFMDFIRSISILSLAKPGLMYKSLKIITQEYRSPIWSEVFNGEAKNPKDYILLNNVADLLNTTRGALNNQAKSNQ